MTTTFTNRPVIAKKRLITKRRVQYLAAAVAFFVLVATGTFWALELATNPTFVAW